MDFEYDAHWKKHFDMPSTDFEGNENLIAAVDTALSVTDLKGYHIVKSDKGVYRVLYRVDNPSIMLAKIDVDPAAFKDAPTINDKSDADKALKLVLKSGMVYDIHG